MEHEGTQHEEQTLWNQIFSRENLYAALARVQRNRGAPGIDGMTVDELTDHLREHWLSIRARLDAGVYQPSPVKQTAIPKPKGGTRLLGIPTVLDRFIQQAIHQVLSPIFEPTFSEHSYGFRPGRSAHQAVRAARTYIQSGYEWVVDIDLERFFDTVHHDRLMARMKQVISDTRVLKLVHAYLKAGIMADGIVSERETGTPQGSPLSPLLSNIVLTELDRKLEERGLHFARYADDCNIYVRSERAAHRVLQSTQTFIEDHLRLKVNEEKSAVGRADMRQFLGFTFRIKEGKVAIWIAPHSLDRVKHKVRQITRRNQGRSLEDVRDHLNAYLAGWMGYFALVDSVTPFKDLDRWLRHRMRQLCWKQWKTRTRKYQNLRALGISHRWAARNAGSSKGYWRMSNSPVLNRALNNAYWRDFGLIGFTQRYELRRT